MGWEGLGGDIKWVGEVRNNIPWKIIDNNVTTLQNNKKYGICNASLAIKSHSSRNYITNCTAKQLQLEILSYN